MPLIRKRGAPTSLDDGTARFAPSPARRRGTEWRRKDLYDNSVDDRDAQLVLRAADGRVVKAYGDAPAWAGPILERLVPRE